MEIEVSRSARRFIAKRYGGRVYVWRCAGDVPAWVEGKEPLEAGDTPLPETQRECWKQEIDGIGVFIAEDVVPPSDSEILLLDHRRRPRQRIVAAWATRARAREGLRDVVDLFGSRGLLGE